MSDATTAAPTEAPAETPAEKPVKQKSSKKIILITALTAFLLGGGAGGYMAWNTAKTMQGGSAVADDAKKETHASIETHEGASVIEVSRITLTLRADATGKTRNLLVTPVIMAHATGEHEDSGSHGNADDAAAELIPALRDSFIEYLSLLEPRDLHGSAGMSLLRSELKQRAEAVLDGYVVDEVLFSDLVVQ